MASFLAIVRFEDARGNRRIDELRRLVSETWISTRGTVLRKDLKD